MGGGLMQLVAYGAQDIYLTGNPQITFFKVVYRRHTNFSIESIQQTFNGTAGFGKKINCAISRSGDLASSMLLDVVVNIPEYVQGDYGVITGLVPGVSWAASPFLGHRLIKYVDIDIGGQRIDRHYGEWMHIWSQLVLPESKKTGFEEMIGHKLGVVGSGAAATAPFSNASVADTDYYKTVHLQIPLQFWFCRNPGLAIPLIALQYHDVKITVEFNDIQDCFNRYTNVTWGSGLPDNLNNSVTLGDTSLWVDYIYLDTDERRRFAQLTHTYLIEQVQHPGAETCRAGTNNLKLPFNHPVKELVWVIQNDTFVAKGEWYNYTNDSVVNGVGPLFPGGKFTNVTSLSINNCVTASIKLNSQDRISDRTGDYFNQTQPYYHHTRIPYTGINCYSFALRPEEHQPSGTCNFSRIDNASLYFNALGPKVGAAVGDVGSTTIKIFAINYNILRIMSGMAGLAYSN